MQIGSGESPTLKKITGWIARVMLALGEGGRGGLKLNIRDPGDYGAKGLLREYALDPEKQADKIALEVEHDAQEEADGAGRGPHHFELYAYRDQEKGYFNSHRFILVSENAPEETERESNGQSLLAQQQRHFEAMMKIAAQKDAMMFQAMANMMGTQSERLMHYESTQLQSQQIAHQNTLDRAKIEYDLEMRKFMIECAKMVANVGIPIAVPKIIAKLVEEDDTKNEAAQSNLPEMVSTPAIEAKSRVVEHAPVEETADTTIVVAPAPKNGHAKAKKGKKKS